MFPRHFHKSTVVNAKLLLEMRFSNQTVRGKLNILQKLQCITGTTREICQVSYESCYGVDFEGDYFYFHALKDLKKYQC